MAKSTTKTKNNDDTVTIVSNVPKTYYRKKMSAMEFIQSLCENAQSAVTGGYGYEAWLDESDGKKVINFATRTMTKKIEVTQSYMFSIGNDEGKSNIISFQPTYNLTASDDLVVSTEVLDAFTNQMYQFNFNNNGGYTSLTKDRLSQTGNEDIIYFSGSAYTNSELERMAANLWLKHSKSAMDCTIEMFGDPNIKVGTNISIIAIMPSGIPHLSSGIYLISNVEHTISGGTFKTVVTASRNSIDVTVEDGKIKFTVGAATETGLLNEDEESSKKKNKDKSKNSSGGNSSSPKASGKRGEFINELRKHIGKPYVWGGKGPDVFDCSGLVWYCAKAIGLINEGYSNTNGMAASDSYGKLISNDLSQAPQGAIVISSGGNHVFVVSGPGMMIHAPQPGESVCEVSSSWVTGIIAIRDPYA